MKKDALLKEITKVLKANLLVLHEAALSTHAEATDASNRAENKYDTRSLEAGYLAQGQARQVQELVDAITLYETLESRAFAASDAIDLTAVVEVESGGALATYFIGPKSGGLEIPRKGGGPLVVITPASPLGQSLMGKKVGQSWTAKIRGAPITYRIASVQ